MSAIPTYGGCCRNDEWRGRPCPYHEGYEDGLDDDAYHEGYKDGYEDGRETLDDYRSVVARLLDGWVIDGQDPAAYPELWVKPNAGYDHITDAERAVIDEVTP